MPEKTLWGLPMKPDADLSKPIASMPDPADNDKRRRDQQRRLETLIEEAEPLARLWDIGHFRGYCEARMKEAMHGLLKAQSEAEMRQFQALSRAWSTIISDFSGKGEHIRQLQAQLAELHP